MYILVAIVLIIIIYIVAQNNRIQVLFDQLYQIDSEIEQKLRRYINANGEIDIFSLQEIRSMVLKDYIHQKLIDDFRIYKSSMYKVKVIIKSGLAVQALEMITNMPERHLVETTLDYNDLELLKK